MTTKCCFGLKLHQVAELAVLAVISLLLWAVLTLPTIFFFIPKPTDTVGQPGLEQLKEILEANVSTESDSISNPFAPVNCSEGFYTGPYGYCHAECGRWNLFPRTTQVVSDVFSIIALSVGIVAAIVVMVIAVWKRKRFFKFPSVFVVYGTFSAAVFDVFVLIGYMDRTRFFCSSRNQVESYSNATPFCSFIGVVTYYIVVEICYWWLLRIVTLFFTLKFPIFSRSIQSSNKVIVVHAVMAAVATLLPLVTIIAAFPTGGFSNLRIIPPVCAPTNVSTIYYGIVLPLGIVLAIGVPMLISTLWIIFKQRTKLQIPGKSQRKPGTPEIKVVILLCYCLSLAILYLVAFSALYYTFPQYRGELAAYLECESIGILTCDRTLFERFKFPILLSVTLMLVWIFPVGNLVYVISVEGIKRQYTKHVRQSRVILDSKDKVPNGLSQKTIASVPVA